MRDLILQVRHRGLRSAYCGMTSWELQCLCQQQHSTKDHTARNDCVSDKAAWRSGSLQKVSQHNRGIGVTTVSGLSTQWQSSMSSKKLGALH